MLSYIFDYRYHLISLSTSCIFLLTTIQRYNRLRNEYDHYERRYRMLNSITTQKRDELEKSLKHINQLLRVENQMSLSTENEHDHGDHISMPTFFSFDNFLLNDDDDDDESEDDPLLQRLKFTRPTRLKSSLKHIANENHSTIEFTDRNQVHTIYNDYLSDLEIRQRI